MRNTLNTQHLHTHTNSARNHLYWLGVVSSVMVI